VALVQASPHTGEAEGSVLATELHVARLVTDDQEARRFANHRGLTVIAVENLENAMADTRYQLEGNAPQLYERETVHTLAWPLAELMFAHVALQAGDRVLDAACGTGIVTRVAAQRYGNLAHITGVDLNPGMLDVARVHMPITGIPVEWRQGDVCALPFPDEGVRGGGHGTGTLCP